MIKTLSTLIFSMALVLPVAQADHLKSAFPRDCRHLRRTLKEIPEYSALWHNHKLRSQFDQFMRWLASPDIAAPDAVYLLQLVDRGDSSIELQSHLFHEYIEFNNWMRLGHKFSDIIDVEYYSKNYPTVYPVAHCNAIVAEKKVLNTFAKQNKISEVPMIAYDLAFPDYEKRQELANALPTPLMVRQLRFNKEFFHERVDVDDIRTAMRIFQNGGYRYNHPEVIVDAGSNFLELSLSERESLLKLSSITDCQPIP